MGWVCCCWTVGSECLVATGGASQPSAIRCQSSANRNRAARIGSFCVACAASRHACARRRYSAPRPITRKTRSTLRTQAPPPEMVQRRAQPENGPAKRTGRGQAQRVLTMRQSSPSTAMFPTGVCEIGSCPRTVSLLSESSARLGRPHSARLAGPMSKAEFRQVASPPLGRISTSRGLCQRASW